jgi:hypothetical protein
MITTLLSGPGGRAIAARGPVARAEIRAVDRRIENRFDRGHPWVRGEWRDPREMWPLLYAAEFRLGYGYNCDGGGCFTPDSSIGAAFAALQDQINRFSAAAGFPPLTPDDRIDAGTAAAAIAAARIAAMLPQVQAQTTFGTRQVMELAQNGGSPDWIAQRTGALLAGFHFAADTAEATWPALLAPGGGGAAPSAPGGLFGALGDGQKPWYKKTKFWLGIAAGAAVGGGSAYLISRRR